MENVNSRVCKCPYCFKKFVPAAVAFRAETVYMEQDLEDMSSEEAEAKKNFLEAEDPVYEEFWKKYPGSRPDDDPYAKNPVIWNTEPPGQSSKMAYLKGTHSMDSDGFINEVVDSEGAHSKIRICPHCHNRLPFAFGKYPVKYIAVVGITSSGKTIYLSQVLRQIKGILARAGMTVVGTHTEVDSFVEKHKVVKGQPLPTGNTTHILTQPLPLNVRNSQNMTYTLVFYDIAGENCVVPEQMEKYGAFIENADGIVMIVDPRQFDELFHIGGYIRGEAEPVQPEKVIEAMYNTFVAESAGGKSSIPIAVAISKSDLLRSCVGTDMNFMRDIDYREYNGYGFPCEDFNQMNMEVHSLLKPANNSMQGKIFMDSLNECFSNKAMFAFSALNVEAIMKKDDDDVAYSIIEEDPETVRVEDPIFWILYQLGIIAPIHKRAAAPVQEQKKKGGWFGRRK